MWGFLLEAVPVMHDALDGVHVVLQLSDLTNEESEGLLNTDDVAEGDAGLEGGVGERAMTVKMATTKVRRSPSISIRRLSQR